VTQGTTSQSMVGYKGRLISSRNRQAVARASPMVGRTAGCFHRIVTEARATSKKAPARRRGFEDFGSQGTRVDGPQSPNDRVAQRRRTLEHARGPSQGKFGQRSNVDDALAIAE
jgi:hypothetical protein